MKRLFLLAIICMCNFISLAQPHAEFLLSPTSGCAGDNVSPINLSFGGIVSYHWDFDDGNTSSLISPTHTYTDTGTYTITLTVTDGSGLTDTWTETYTFRPPVAQFVANPTTGCAIPHTVFFTDQSTLPDTWFWDFGDGNTSTLQNPVHNYTAVGSYTVTLTVTDTIFGCSDVATSQVNVSIPTAIIDGAFGYFGCGPLTVNFTESSSNSGPGSIAAWNWNFGDGNTSTQQNPTHIYQTPGVYNVSLTVTNSNGCTSTDVNPAFVQVIGPDVNFGADTTSGCPPFTVNFTDSTVFGAPIISWSWNFGDGNTSSLQNPTHTYTTYDTMDVSLTVTDIDGCSRTMTINNYIDTQDDINPVISCPGNQNVSFDGNCQFTLPDYTGMATAIDNCTTNPSITQSPIVGTVINTSQTITLTATDDAGNMASCTFDVIPSDNTNPGIACPGNITQTNDLGQCGATVMYTVPIGTDNCSGSTTSQTAGLPSGSLFPVGTTTNTFVVIDAAGNSANCSFDVVITDTEAPIISCPGNITQTNDAGQCGATVTYVSPVGTDNCSGSTTSQTSGLPSGSLFPVGTTTNTFVVTDLAGNTATCSFDVIVTDTEDPTITCPANIAQNNDVGQCGAMINYVAPVGTDNCPGASTVQTAGLPSGSIFPVGTTSNTFEVTDAAGNTTTCSFDVIITDNAPPTIGCPGNIAQNNDPGQCGAIVNYTAPVGTDNCSGSTTSQTSGLPSGSLFPVGTTTNTFVVTDLAGNTATCSFDVIVMDAEDPTITCPNPLQSCDSILSFPDPVISDNCAGASFALTSGLSSGSTFPVGITTNVYTVTDGTGNTATCSVDITRFQLPTIEAGPNVAIDAGFSHQIDANSSNVQTFDWSPVFDLNDPSIEDPIASPLVTTIYTVTVTSTDGCTATDNIQITVNETIEINNFMSPNGDGKNDTWIIKGNYLLGDCTIQVFDSWGNLIFERIGYDNMWDGTKNGNQLPEGNYYYNISCGSDQPLSGSITLIR